MGTKTKKNREMALKPPLTELAINTEEQGFYSGFSKVVALGSKLFIGLLIVWAAVFSESAGAVLNSIRDFISANTGTWYMWVMAFYIVVCIALALWPATGKIRLGGEDSKPEFSNFSWFSMMFGAGIGIGMLTYATGEPLYHFGTNPDVIVGNAEGGAANNVRAAYKWSFLH